MTARHFGRCTTPPHPTNYWRATIGLLASLLLACIALAADSAEDHTSLADFPKLSAKTDWPWWRGPSRNGIAADDTSAPLTWGEQENIVWRIPVPGRGHSSPVVVGDRIYLTTADKKSQVHSALAFDRATGKQLWKTDVSRGGFPAQNHPKNTEATSTIACDGERLFTTFFHHETVEVIALDLAGKIVWRETAGAFNPKLYKYGYAPSPLLYRNSVIVAFEYDGDSALVALDRTTGKSLWRTKRTSTITFSSPVVAHVGGRDQLLLSGATQVASYDPATGKQLWTTAGTAAATCGTVVWDGNTLFASGGYPQSETIAVKADGSGEVIWQNNQKCYEQSMLARDGHLYALTGQGVLYCWRTADGKEMWKKRLQGPVSSSPVFVGGHIYWANEAGITYVFRANPEKLELVAENRLGDESFASPAIVGGRFYIRTAKGSGDQRQEYLYCIGK